MTETIQNTFRTRAKFLRAQAYGILFIMLCLLLFGAWIFFNAGDITRSDVKTTNTLKTSSDIAKRINTLEKELKAVIKMPKSAQDLANKIRMLRPKVIVLNRNISNITELVLFDINRKISTGEFGNVPGNIDVVDVLKLEIPKSIYHKSLAHLVSVDVSVKAMRFKTNNYIDGTELLASSPKYLQMYKNELLSFEPLFEEAKDLIDQLKVEDEKYLKALDTDKKNLLYSELDELRQGFNIVKERELNQKFGGPSSNDEALNNISIPFLVQTNITRFGPILLILFFVSILVNLYRYNIRLAGYYDARADSLELLELKVDETIFEKFVSSVSPDQFDFGKVPLSPAEHAVELAKTLTEKSK